MVGYVRERKRKLRRTAVAGDICQEERDQQEREAKIQYAVKESTCIENNEDIEFVGTGRAGEKGKGTAFERSHSVEGAQPGEQTTPAPADANPKPRRLLHGAAARSTISRILADKDSDDGDAMRSHSASSDESPPSIRLQEPRWGKFNLLPNTMQNALLPPSTTQPSHPFTQSAFGTYSTSFPAQNALLQPSTTQPSHPFTQSAFRAYSTSFPAQNALLQPPTTQPSHPFTQSAFRAYSTSFPAQNTEEYRAAIPPGSPVSTRSRSFAEPGTVALKGFTSVQAPMAPPSAETGTESGEPIPDGAIPDGDGSW